MTKKLFGDLFTGFDPISRSYAVFEIKNDKSRMVESGFDCEADAVGFMGELEPDASDYQPEEQTA